MLQYMTFGLDGVMKNSFFQPEFRQANEAIALDYINLLTLPYQDRQQEPIGISSQHINQLTSFSVVPE